MHSMGHVSKINMVNVFSYCMLLAQEMTRHDKVVELLQQRQEKDIIQLNKVEDMYELAVREVLYIL